MDAISHNFRRSSFCSSNSCVEVAIDSNRDKFYMRRSGEVESLSFTPFEWSTMLAQLDDVADQDTMFDESEHQEWGNEMTDAPDSEFRKSSYCSGNSCVEIAIDRVRGIVRVKKTSEDEHLDFTLSEWSVFIAGVMHHEFDAR